MCLQLLYQLPPPRSSPGRLKTESKVLAAGAVFLVFVSAFGLSQVFCPYVARSARRPKLFWKKVLLSGNKNAALTFNHE
jgi:hypothetical protein